MPLDVAALASGLEDVASNPPPGIAACAALWADAVEDWASEIVPLSTTVAVAREALETALVVAFSLPAAAASMEVAFLAFATTVGGGMAGYTPTPPPAPVGFATLFSVRRTSHADAAATVAGAIDTWMRTGIATLVAPPNTPVPWS